MGEAHLASDNLTVMQPSLQDRWEVSLVKSLVEALKVRQQDSNKRQPGPGMASGKGQRRHVLVQLWGQMLERRVDIDTNTNNSHRGGTSTQDRGPAGDMGGMPGMGGAR